MIYILSFCLNIFSKKPFVSDINELQNRLFLLSNFSSAAKAPLSAAILVTGLSVGGAVASWLECSTPGRVVRVRVLAGDITLCSWARHFTLTVPLSTQVYLNGYRRNAGGNPAMD